MRYTPAAFALSLLASVSSSVIHSAQPDDLDAKTEALLAVGRADLQGGKVNDAVDAFEAALVRAPGSVTVLLRLAEATREQGMQGKAIHYYREALMADPRNLMAIAGEGAALAEKGAVAKARRNLARLEGMCGKNCEATRQLAAAIDREPSQRVVTAEAVKPDLKVSEN
jgi:Tfp pilus assembly protein PilF